MKVNDESRNLVVPNEKESNPDGNFVYKQQTLQNSSLVPDNTATNTGVSPLLFKERTPTPDILSIQVVNQNRESRRGYPHAMYIQDKLDTDGVSQTAESQVENGPKETPQPSKPETNQP